MPSSALSRKQLRGVEGAAPYNDKLGLWLYDGGIFWQYSLQRKHIKVVLYMKTKKLHIWELALIGALLVALLTALWAQKTQAEVASELVRLHVLAKDDTDYEQAVKLQVRDEVLRYVQPLLEGARTQAQAVAVLNGNLEGIRRAASAAAGERQVAVTLTEEYYPTREYEGFALPAGEYTSLRVILADGEGRNWWCVVYPPLCTELATERMGLLTDETESLITGQEGYVYRFKLLELWGGLKNWMNNGFLA